MDTKEKKSPKEVAREEPARLEGAEKIELEPPEEKKEIGHEEEPMLPKTGEARIKELEDRFLRLAADFDNYKKRMTKEQDMVKEMSRADLIVKVLGVVDEFEIALAHTKKSEHGEFVHGMELIFVKLRDMLKKEGVEEMASIGQHFDPYKHEAIRSEEGEEGKIVEVVQKGYLLKGKVLRHAKVVVGKGK